jgi:hypothetical protein
MSHFKVLVCSFLLAAAVSASANVQADHRYSVFQNAGCGRNSGYGSGTGSYGLNVPVYAPHSSSNGYQSQWNTGYGANQRFNSGHYSPGYSGTTHIRDQYSRPQNFGYYRNTRESAWGSDSYGYGASNSNLRTNTVYDSIHGDYHAVPIQRNRPTYNEFRDVDPLSHERHGVNLNIGW